MKKFILAFVLVSAFCLSAMVWRADDFEDGSVGDIVVYDDDGDTYSWEVVPTTKDKAGSYIARSASSPALTPDNWMCFETGVYVELDSYLSFWVAAESSDNFAETYQVYVNVEGAAEGQMVYEETLTSADWKQVTIDLKPFILAADSMASDATVYAMIRHNGSTDQSALLMDDIMHYTRPLYLYDEGLFFVPDEIVAAYSSIDMQYFIYDWSGWDTEGNFIGYQNCNLHYIITEADGTIQPEATMPLVMGTYTDPNTFDEYNVYTLSMDGYPMGTKMEYWVEATDNSGYDIVGKSLHFNTEWGEYNFVEGFEDSENFDTVTKLPVGWVTFQQGEQLSSWDKPWTWNLIGNNEHTGNYSVSSASQGNMGVWLTEDCLVTPMIRINATDTYLKYFMNAQTLPGLTERWSLLVSTVEGDGTDIENFTEVAQDSIVPTADNLDSWYEKTLLLDDYLDQNIRIMWRHKYSSAEVKLDRYLNIDDVSVAEMPVLNISDPGNAALPGEDFEINATASDYSGIHDITIYYTIADQPEMSTVMTDNGDGTFTGVIPAQPEGVKCIWFAVATDNSVFFNTTTSGNYDLIWLNSSILEWGSGYTDAPEPMGTGSKAAIDWNFGTKGNLFLNQIEIGLAYDAPDLTWKLVEFDPTVVNDVGGGLIYYGAPTNTVIGDLQGTHTFTAGGDKLLLDGNKTPLYGNVALEFDFNNDNELMLDESGNKKHAWQWSSVNNWTTNGWGAFYIKMYVSQTVGIEDEFVSSTTELCQNYPNPFNPVTSISFYNRIAGGVSLTVYNTKGEAVATLINETLNEGFRKVDFDASKFNSGVYYYTLKTPEKTLTKKMVLVK